ncbi:MAG: SDR family NAD(P)-dependent oxidoreductase [Actinomycetota bacterium]|nr:SDR family NAD(P)-dependent oxidoreductase [Actinomycetota bacterium]
MGEIVLITGGSRGIGFETAAALGRSGATVIVTGRSARSVEPAAAALADEGIDIDSAILDVTSYPDVVRLAEAVRTRHGRLDVLVNNAGVAGEWTFPGGEYVDPRAAQITLDTNVLGVLHMVEAFLPLLRRSAAGRIVNVSSYMGSLAIQAGAGADDLVVPAYQASKAALNSITLTLSKSLAGTAISVTSVDPGFVQTDFSPINRAQAPLTAAQGAEPVVRAAAGGPASGSFIGRDGELPW